MQLAVRTTLFISDSEAQSQLFIGELIFVRDLDLRLLDLRCSERRRRITQIVYGELQVITWMYDLNFTTAAIVYL